MKKVLSVILALVMVLSMSVSVFATSGKPSVGGGTGDMTSGNLPIPGPGGSTTGNPLDPNGKTSPETGVESSVASAMAAVVLLGSAVVLASKEDK